MTRGTGWHALAAVPVLIDFLAARERPRLPSGSDSRGLATVVVCQRDDHGIVERRGHTPHIPQGVGVAARLGSERLQLRDYIARMLTGEHWKLGRKAMALWAVATGARAD